jgi:hypothetical protein
MSNTANCCVGICHRRNPYGVSDERFSLVPSEDAEPPAIGVVRRNEKRAHSIQISFQKEAAHSAPSCVNASIAASGTPDEPEGEQAGGF